MSQSTYFRDDPDPDNDSLERRAFARRIVGSFTEMRAESSASVTASLIGPWGSGKSTVLKMIVNGLEVGEGPKWTVVDLNPWLYSDAESLQIAFFVALREALPPGKRWKKGRESIGNFFTSISPFGKVNGLAGVDASSAIEAIGKKIAGDISANAKKLKAENVLSELDSPILFVMDDLDRLTPEELMMVFKLVRLVGRLPNVYYLLAYDEKTMLDLIQQTDIARGQPLRSREYMEKIVQVRFDLPQMRPAQSASMISKAMESLFSRYAIELTEMEQERFSSAYREHLRRRLTTPRTIIQYFAQLEAFYGDLAQEVDFVDFMLLTFLRTFEPGVYENISGAWRDELLGGNFTDWKLKKEDPAQKMDRWTGLLQEAQVAATNVAGVMAVLGKMFLPINTMLNSYSTGGGTSRYAAKRGIGHRDYFERYFFFGVPEDDIPDARVRTMVESFENGLQANIDIEVQYALISDTSRVVRKLERFTPGHPKASAALLPIMAETYHLVRREFLSPTGDPQGSIEYLTEKLFSELETSQVPATIEIVTQASQGLLLAVITLTRAKKRDEELSPTWVLIQNELDARLSQIAADLLCRPLREVSDLEYRHIYWWREVAGRAKTDPLLTDALHKGVWDSEEFLIRCIRIAHWSGGSETLSEFDVEILEKTVGLDYFYRKFRNQISSAEDGLVAEQLAPTEANKRRYAFSRLKWHQRRDSEKSQEG
ncbi:P-loop NTPase fold protein [Streptomyces caniferus]|uniref:KAP family P-loop NTPase fold protein n=1 Tax=Streptomyces caniferus TaxID=285557 RepID=UPI0034526711